MLHHSHTQGAAHLTNIHSIAQLAADRVHYRQQRAGAVPPIGMVLARLEIQAFNLVLYLQSLQKYTYLTVHTITMVQHQSTEISFQKGTEGSALRFRKHDLPAASHLVTLP